MTQDFYSLSRPALEEVIQQTGGPKYASTQIFNWVYRQGTTDFLKMSNLSKMLREALPAKFIFPKAEIEDRQISKDGTRKYLFRVRPDILIESVMIKQPRRMTLCVSSQYGCGMACAFCRTGTMGFQGNLTSGEIVRQVLNVAEDAKNFNDSFSNIVFMGMGEPLHNFNNVTEAIRIITDDQGLSLAPRKITVSTVGLVPAIKKFFEAGLGVNLAVSLNATTNEVRDKIMPVNKRFPIEELLETISVAPLRRRQKVTIEYVLLGGVNDTPDDMRRLVKLMRNLPTKVNLIPYNTNADLGFNAPEMNTIDAWHRYLNNHNVDATIRWSKGQDIKAACGQLATSKTKS